MAESPRDAGRLQHGLAALGTLRAWSPSGLIEMPRARIDRRRLWFLQAHGEGTYERMTFKLRHVKKKRADLSAIVNLLLGRVNTGN